MPARRMYIEKFGEEVLIDEDHPLAIAQKALDAQAETETVEVEEIEEIADPDDAAAPPKVVKKMVKKTVKKGRK